jgi:hypothetical protein
LLLLALQQVVDKMGRGKKWDGPETEAGCAGWAQASNNPVVGAYQKSDKFWADVFQKFVALSPTDLPPGTYRHRSIKALESYLKDQVFPSVNKFQIALRRVKMQQTLQEVSRTCR